MEFIDNHRGEFGVESICSVLREHGVGIAPNTYHTAKNRPPSQRALRDAELKPKILKAYKDNLFVYGAAKIWGHLNRQGTQVARCTVERLMRELGLTGARRGKAFKVTTTSDDKLHRPEDLVDRVFKAPSPNRLWVADLTYVKTHSGWVYVAFIVDVYSRMVVGWQASTSLKTGLAIDALEMAIWNRERAGADLDNLIHHSDRGVQYLSIVYSDRLSDNEIVASVGSKADSYDNALIESFNGLYKWELIYRQGPWRGLEDVEYATLEYVDWFNNRRLHGQITAGPGYLTPVEAEEEYYNQDVTVLETVCL